MPFIALISDHAKPVSQTNPKILGIRVSESVSGMAIPLIYGMTRVSTRVISAVNFQKHSGSGLFGLFSGPPTYTADVRFLLAHNVVQTIPGRWADATDQYSTKIALGTYTVTAGGPTGWYIDLTGSIPQGDSHLYWISAVRRVDLPYSASFTDYGDPQGTRTFAGTQGRILENAAFRYPMYPGTRLSDVFTWPGHAGNLSIDLAGNVDAFASGAQIEVVFHYRDTTNGGDGYPLHQSHHENADQQFVSPLTDHGLTFNDCCGIYEPSANLGSSGIVTKNDYEVLGHIPYGVYEVETNPQGFTIIHLDCNPADMIGDLFSSGQLETTTYLGSTAAMYHGLNSSQVPANVSKPFVVLDLALMRTYCNAAKLHAALYMDSQRDASDWLKDLFEIGNTAPVYSGNTLKAIPYDEQSIASEWGTYPSPTSSGPVWAVPLKDLLGATSDSPVTVVRERQTDAVNVLPVGFTDRANGYGPGQIVAHAHSEIGNFGTRRGSPKQYDAVHCSMVANRVGAVQVKQQALAERIKVKFKLPHRYHQVEPMDLMRLHLTDLADLPDSVTSLGGTVYPPLVGWTGVDIDSPPHAGSDVYSESTGIEVVTGYGNINGGGDSGRYVYHSNHGDGDYILNGGGGLGTTSENGFGGLMIRGALASGSPHIALGITGAWGTRYYYKTGGVSYGGTHGLGASAGYRTWLKITKIGTRFFLYLSDDGASWSPADYNGDGSPHYIDIPDIGSGFTWGMFVTDQGGSVLSTAANFYLTSPVTPFQGTYNGLTVRLTSVEENEKLELDCEAEPFVYGLHSATEPLSQGSGYVPPGNGFQDDSGQSWMVNGTPIGSTGTNGTPSSGGTGSVMTVNPPIIVQTGNGYMVAVSSESAGYFGHALYLSLYGDAQAVYGPCAGVTRGATWRSLYEAFPFASAGPNFVEMTLAGAVPPDLWDATISVGHWKWGNATTGVLLADVAAHADPDTTNNVQVDLSVCKRALVLAQSYYSPYSTLQSVCALEGSGAYPGGWELIKYTDASAIDAAAYKYQIAAASTINRAFNSIPDSGNGVSHSLGARFAFFKFFGVTIAPGIWQFSGIGQYFDPLDAGRQIYFRAAPIDGTGTEYSLMSAGKATAVTFVPPADIWANQSGGSGPLSYTILENARISPILVLQIAGLSDSININYYPRKFTIPAPGGTTRYYVFAEDPHYLGDYFPSAVMNRLATIASGGAGYAVGDTGVLSHFHAWADDIDATYQVTSVDSSGTVTGLTITGGGQNYTVTQGGFGLSTPPYPTRVGGGQPGVGTGLAIHTQGIGWGKDGPPERAPSKRMICTTSAAHIADRGYIYMGYIDATPTGGASGTLWADGQWAAYIPDTYPLLYQPNATTIAIGGAIGTDITFHWQE